MVTVAKHASFNANPKKRALDDSELVSKLEEACRAKSKTIVSLVTSHGKELSVEGIISNVNIKSNAIVISKGNDIDVFLKFDGGSKEIERIVVYNGVVKVLFEGKNASKLACPLPTLREDDGSNEPSEENNGNEKQSTRGERVISWNEFREEELKQHGIKRKRIDIL